MKDQLISLETAKLAKEKGFNSVDNYYFTLDAPENTPLYPVSTQSLLAKWLREVHRVFVEPVYERGDWCYVLKTLPTDEDIANSGECEDGDLWLDSDTINASEWFLQEYKSFEEALEEGLKAGLALIVGESTVTEIVKQKRK